jgi:hypothetical protein
MEGIFGPVRDVSDEGQSPAKEIQPDTTLEDRKNPSSALPGYRPLRRLICREDLQEVLDLNQEQAEKLINTGQITAMSIVGQERFDIHQVDRLIAVYKTTAERRMK